MLMFIFLLKQMTAAPSEYTGGVAKTVSMFSKLMNQGSSIVVEGVKNFVLKENVSFFFHFHSSKFGFRISFK